MKRAYFIYHSPCYDGFGAAWAAYRKFADTAEYIPYSYSQDPLEVMQRVPQGARVYLLDISFPRETIVDLRQKFDIFVIDHHKTAEEDLRGLADVIFDMQFSGAVLTWRYFHPNDAVPDFLLYIQDRDLWRWTLHGSKSFSAALRSYPFDFKVWNELSTRWDTLIMEGHHILRHQSRIVNQICDQSYLGQMKDERIPIVNATAFWSEVGHELLRRYKDHQMVASYYFTKSKKVVWSIRSKSGFDCSAIAKKYGGGGHMTSAGFVEQL